MRDSLAYEKETLKKHLQNPLCKKLSHHKNHKLQYKLTCYDNTCIPSELYNEKLQLPKPINKYFY